MSEHFHFPCRLIDRQPEVMLDMADRQRDGGTFVEQSDQLLVDVIDPLSERWQPVHVQAPRSQRTNAPALVGASAPASPITVTSALPTTAASA